MLALFIVATAGVALALVTSVKSGPKTTQAFSKESSTDLVSSPRIDYSHQPQSLEALLQIPSDKLGEVDIGVMNLLCAQGLPGSENLDIPKEVALLDEWADLVKRETQANWHLFRQNPADYEHSENNFKMFMLVEVLQARCGIHYNPDWLYISTNRNVPRQEGYAPYRDARNIFINGLIEQRMGTCANMATFYVAVARRCGYPVYLVRAKSHFFARWDDGKERFNCEGTNRGMVEPYRRTDEHYRKWPAPLTDEELRRDGYYLQNMSPAALLAEFLFMRGDAMWQHGFNTPAIGCFMESYRRAPQFREYQQRMVDSLKLVSRRLDELNQSRSTATLAAHQQYPNDPLAEFDALSILREQILQLEMLKTELAQLQPTELKQ